MRKILFVLMAITMVACKKEEITPSVDKGTTVTLYVNGGGVPFTELEYYDITGEHQYESHISNAITIDNIDWSKPFIISSKVVNNPGTLFSETVIGSFTLNKENELIEYYNGYFFHYNN